MLPILASCSGRPAFCSDRKKETASHKWCDVTQRSFAINNGGHGHFNATNTWNFYEWQTKLAGLVTYICKYYRHTFSWDAHVCFIYRQIVGKWNIVSFDPMDMINDVRNITMKLCNAQVCYEINIHEPTPAASDCINTTLTNLPFTYVFQVMPSRTWHNFKCQFETCWYMYMSYDVGSPRQFVEYELKYLF